MATTVIALDIAEYLAAKGEGVLGTDIFVDYQPDQPDNSITIYDMGGTNPQEPPEAWREITVMVRCKDHATGYEKVWRILNYMLSPNSGLITMGTNRYAAQLKDIPSIYDRDQKNRYLFRFQVVLYKVSGNISDHWLNALVDWTGTLLGSTWTVSSVWPGSVRPCVIWSLGSIYTADGVGTTFRLHKKFTANVLCNTPDEKMAGTISIVTGLKQMVKLPVKMQYSFDTFHIAVEAIRYLTVQEPWAEYQAKSMTNAQVSVTLSRLIKDLSEEMPLMTLVGIAEEVK